ncbi:MAG TPA: nodulation protein NfeD [Candidatus Sulfotelmatobacter sp.]|jgi:membrane-bound serine protease (ClpP class)
MKRSALLSLILLFGTVFFGVSARAQVVEVTIDDTIQPVSAEYISRAIDQAQRSNAQAVLIEMNTPGGLISSTREIIEKITSSPVPVIVYVTPTGGHAGSAGIFILESADIAAMAPGTAAGAAHPVELIGPMQVKTDEEMKRKIENDTAALIRSFTSKRGRNVEAAESAVRESKSFTEQEALAQHLIDYIASSPEDLFHQMQGKSFKRFGGETATLNLVGQSIAPFEMTLKEKILDELMDPNLAFILLAIGALALYVEFNHPGAVIPGTVGVVFILVAVFALNLLPTRFASLVLILGAFALFAAEAKFASHGVLTVGGIALLTLGGLLLVDSPIPEMRVHLVTALAVSIPLGFITAFLMTIALRARRNKIVTGEQGLIGETGVVQSALSPEGKVFIHGELWDAVAAAPLPTGQVVVVKSIDGLTLRVGPLTGAAAETSAPAAL